VRPLRDDDCFAAAVATTLQVPPEHLPDAHIDERLRARETVEQITASFWTEWNRWLSDRQLRMTVHPTPPVNRRRWIGIVPFLGAFNDHCLVMSRDELLFDPVPPRESATGRSVRQFNPADVRSGLTFEKVARPTQPRSKRRCQPN
jgi:hypothetical protein